MQKIITLDDRDLENADIIGSKRFNENKKRQLTMSWNLKKMQNADRDILGTQGEIAFEKWCHENDLMYQSDWENTECRTSKDDNGDGIIFINRQAYTVEVKTTTAKNPHLIIPEYQFKNQKDIYVLIKKTSNSKFKIMGFIRPDELEDFYDDSCQTTVNTCYKAHYSHLCPEWEEFVELFSEE
jgi:hypothetical protein